jgi:hypothetical protein
MRNYVLESSDTQNKFCRMCSKIHTSCSHLQMELNCSKTPSMLSVMNTEFVSMMRGCQVGTKINHFTPRLKVVDNVECLLQLYCWNKLAVLYSYDNESCVHAKHIMIMNML